MNKSYHKKYETFLKLLYQARVGNNLRQIDLAEKLKVPQSFISKIESGERRLDVLELMEICKVLNIDIADFVRKLQKELNETK